MSDEITTEEDELDLTLADADDGEWDDDDDEQGFDDAREEDDDAETD